MTMNSPSGSTLQCDTWLWDDMPLNSPSGSTLQYDTQLWDHDTEFSKWQHPAMWQVTLGWYAIEFAQTSATLEFYIWFRFQPYHCSRRHSEPVYNILSKSDHPQQKQAQILLTNRTMLICKVVEVWQDFLSEYVDKKFMYICYRRLIRHEWIYYGSKNCVIDNS